MYQVEQMYESRDGSFKRIKICEEDKRISDALVIILRRLKIVAPINKELLLATWKTVPRDNVRFYMDKVV